MCRPLTAQERSDFLRAQCVLLEQQAAQERIDLDSLEPEEREAFQKQQVQLRFTSWIINTGLETGECDFSLLDGLCQQE